MCVKFYISYFSMQVEGLQPPGSLQGKSCFLTFGNASFDVGPVMDQLLYYNFNLLIGMFYITAQGIVLGYIFKTVHQME